jgi:hypothetical protein
MLPTANLHHSPPYYTQHPTTSFNSQQPKHTISRTTRPQNEARRQRHPSMVMVRIPSTLLLLPLSIPHPSILTSLSSYSTVISAFAILILGILGLLFNRDHPELVGGAEDPEHGSDVAATCLVAVLIYAVSSYPLLDMYWDMFSDDVDGAGVLGVLWYSRRSAYAGESEGEYCVVEGREERMAGHLKGRRHG